MFEPSWFIAGNVVFKMNGFEDTEMLATYAEAEEGGVCELVMIVGVISIKNNKNRIPTKTFLLSIS